MQERRGAKHEATGAGAEVGLAIADIGIAVSTGPEGPALRVDGAAARFLAPARDPAVRVSARWGAVEAEARGRVRFDSGGHWQLLDDAGAFVFVFRSAGLGPLPYRVARFSPDFSRGDVVLHRPYFEARAAIDPLGYPLDELLVMHLLGQGRGVELHACGIVDAGGRGHLFVGPSGAGKTTMARHWEREAGTVVLSDDRIVVRRHGDALRMHGTPWHGEAALSVRGSAPLVRVYFIRHGARGEVGASFTRIRGAAYLARLYACVFCPFYRKAAVEFTVDSLGDIAARVPGYELCYFPGMDVAAAIMRLEDRVQ